MSVFGHTHKAWVAEFGGALFVTCGAVGKPKVGDPRTASRSSRTAAIGSR